jgi:hypothetical protein
MAELSLAVDMEEPPEEGLPPIPGPATPPSRSTAEEGVRSPVPAETGQRSGAGSGALPPLASRTDGTASFVRQREMVAAATRTPDAIPTQAPLPGAPAAAPRKGNNCCACVCRSGRARELSNRRHQPPATRHQLRQPRWTLQDLEQMMAKARFSLGGGQRMAAQGQHGGVTEQPQPESQPQPQPGWTIDKAMARNRMLADGAASLPSLAS